MADLSALQRLLGQLGTNSSALGAGVSDIGEEAAGIGAGIPAGLENLGIDASAMGASPNPVVKDPELDKLTALHSQMTDPYPVANRSYAPPSNTEELSDLMEAEGDVTISPKDAAQAALSPDSTALRAPASIHPPGSMTMAKAVSAKPARAPTFGDYAAKIGQAAGEAQTLRGAQMIAEGGGKIGAGIAGAGTPTTVVKPTGDFSALGEEAKEKVPTAIEKQKANMQELAYKKTLDEFMSDEQKRDPNSPYSKGIREYMKMVMPGMNVAGVSGAQLGQFLPIAEKHFDAKMKMESMKLQRQSNEINRQAMFQQRDRRIDQMDQRKYAEMGRQMGLSMNSALANKNNPYGADAKLIQSADRIKAALDVAKGDYSKLPPQIVDEIATGVATFYSGGNQTAEATVHRFIGQGTEKDIAKVKGYILSAPQAANMGEWIKLYKDIADRELEKSQSRIAKVHNQLASAYAELRNKSPAIYNTNILSVEEEMPYGFLVPEPEIEPELEILQNKKIMSQYHTNPEYKQAIDLAKQKLLDHYHVFK